MACRLTHYCHCCCCRWQQELGEHGAAALPAALAGLRLRLRLLTTSRPCRARARPAGCTWRAWPALTSECWPAAVSLVYAVVRPAAQHVSCAGLAAAATAAEQCQGGSLLCLAGKPSSADTLPAAVEALAEPAPTPAPAAAATQVAAPGPFPAAEQATGPPTVSETVLTGLPATTALSATPQAAATAPAVVQAAAEAPASPVAGSAMSPAPAGASYGGTTGVPGERLVCRRGLM